MWKPDTKELLPIATTKFTPLDLNLGFLQWFGVTFLTNTHRFEAHKMARVCMTLLFAWNVLFMGEKALSLVGDRCSSNYDCFNTYNKVCCFSSGCSSHFCVGQPCSTHGDCGGENECCKYHICTTFGCVECQSNSNCGKFEHCCKRQYFNSTGSSLGPIKEFVCVSFTPDNLNCFRVS